MKWLEKIKERVEKATPGPADCWQDEEGYWHISFPKIERGFGGSKFGWMSFGSADDVNFEAHARTDVPKMLEALNKAAEFAEKIEELSPLHERERRTLAREFLKYMKEMK